MRTVHSKSRDVHFNKQSTDIPGTAYARDDINIKKSEFQKPLKKSQSAIDDCAALLDKKANQATKRKLKTRTSSRKGFCYFYQANYQRKFKVDFSKLDNANKFVDENNAGGQSSNQENTNMMNNSLQFLNSEFKKFKSNIREIKMWDAYEKHWHNFTTSLHEDALHYNLQSVPLPINNYSFIFHIRRVLENKNELNYGKNSAELWSRVKREALRRYHPDKFSKYFSKLEDNDSKDEIMKKVNSIAQLLNDRFQF